MNQELTEFARQMKKDQDEIAAASGRKQKKMAQEWSAKFGLWRQELLKQGISEEEISKSVGIAYGITPEQFDAANSLSIHNDDDVGEGSDESGEVPELPIDTTDYFCPMDEDVIKAFAAGELDDGGLIKIICDSSTLEAFDDLSGVGYVLNDFDEESPCSAVTEGGEIVADADGNAFIPGHIDITDPDGYEYAICDPMVYKTPAEVRDIYALIESLDEKTFAKKADIKKLVKSGFLDGYTNHSAKKEADYIISELWGEFEQLREVYRAAVKYRKGLVLFSGSLRR